MKPGQWFRMLTPLLLLGVCLLVWFEHWLPGVQALTSRFGDDFVLRFCLGLLCLYVLLLWGESLRLHAMLTSVLAAMRDFGKARAADGQDGAGKRLEAARLLVGALESADPQVRQTSRQHLARIAGRDLGDDAAAWRRWLAEQDAAAGRTGSA